MAIIKVIHSGLETIIPENIEPKDIKVEKEQLKITWPDQHVSEYDLNFLKRHAYAPKLNEKLSWSFPKKTLWNKSTWDKQKTPLVSYEKVMKTEEGLAEWLTKIEQYGWCQVEGVPVSPEATEQLARRICFIRESHYGGFWDFTANLAHGDTAYTNLAIGAHTDSTYFTDPVGLQLFHLLEHKGEGGHTLLVDGFHIANIMKDKHFEHYKTLTEFRIPTHSAGDESILITPTPNAFPLIQLNPLTKEIYQIRYNNHDRSVLSGQYYSQEEIRKFYKALKIWRDLVVSPENEYWTKMKPGTATIVDNWRVMHGRSSFTGNRRLCGAYLNWDDYKSRVHLIALKGKAKNDL